MANTTNLMSIAPNQPASSTRATSQRTQPKYKAPARQGRKNFGATFDKVNAKLEEVKQGVQDLKDTGKKLAQVEEDAKPLGEKKQAQGQSETPQDAPQQDETLSAVEKNSLTPADKPKDTTSAPKEEIQTADIFFRDNENPDVQPQVEKIPIVPTAQIILNETGAVETVDAPIDETIETETDTSPLDKPKIPRPRTFSLKNFFWKRVRDLSVTPEAEKILPTEVLTDATSADKIDAQPTPLDAANVRYFVAMNSELLPPNLRETPMPLPTAEVPQIDGVKKLQPAQNLMTLMPQTDTNAQSMLNLLGGKSWRLIETPQPLNVQPQVQPQAQVVNVQPQVQVQVQVQVVNVQPQVQPQAQVADVQPQVQPQVQVADVQPQVQVQVQVADVQPQIQPQAQVAEIQPQIQPQAQVAEIQPQVQPQAQVAEVQPQVQVQAQVVDVQPQIQVQAQVVDVQPQVQPQAQSVDVQPQIQPQAQVVDVQPQIQPQAQVVDVQPQVQPQAQPVEVQPQVQPQAQPVEVQPQVQPQAQPVEVQPQVQPQAQVAEVQPQIQPQVQVADVQPQAQVQPEVQAEIQAAQPVIQQRIDVQPAQILSDMLGVNVQVEDVTTTAPVTAPQAAPQQFEQETPQRDAQQNFQGQTFTAPTETQAQPVSTGGEIFTVPLTTSDAPQTQPIAPTQAPDAPPPTPEDFDVPAQIVRQARLIRTAENTQMVIKLNPEHLGELTLKISVSSNGAVNASFHSDNAQVRTIIENSLVQLRQELNNQGLKVENVQVYAGLSEDGGLMNGQGGQAWQQNRQQRQGNRRINLDALERDIDSSAPINENLAAEGVDYTV